MKSKLMAAVIGIGLVCSIALAAVVTENYVFKGQVDFDNGCIWKIAGTKVTSTAAELNIMDGVTVSAAQINAAGGGSAATLTPSLVSNAVLKVYGSNLVIKSGGTVTLPDSTVANAALVGNTELISTISMSIATNANGGTNVVTFTAKDINGVAATYPVLFRFFVSDDSQGTLAAVAGDVAISSGVEIQQVVDKADYYILSTNLAGTVIATITDTPGGTNYIHAVAPCGRISKAVSAFRVP